MYVDPMYVVQHPGSAANHTGRYRVVILADWLRFIRDGTECASVAEFDRYEDASGDAALRNLLDARTVRCISHG